MRRLLISFPVLTILLAVADAQTNNKDAKDAKGTLKPGANLPGPFHPYNVTGPRKGKFHCQVTENALDPFVMIVVRSLDFTDPLKALLGELDNRIEKNPNVRLGAFAVFLSDDLPDVVKNDDKREDLEKKLLDLEKAAMLRRVVLCLDSKPDLEAYGLDDNAWATIILVNKYKIVSVHALTKEQLDAAKVDAIVAEVADKLGAKRK